MLVTAERGVTVERGCYSRKGMLVTAERGVTVERGREEDKHDGGSCTVTDIG